LRSKSGRPFFGSLITNFRTNRDVASVALLAQPGGTTIATRTGFLVGGILLIVLLGLPGAYTAYWGLTAYSFCSSFLGPYAPDYCGFALGWGIVGLVLALIGLIGGLVLLVKSNQPDPYSGGSTSQLWPPYDAGYSRGFVPIGTGQTPDAAGQISGLKSLLDSGVLTPEEYETKKKRILAMSFQGDAVEMEARGRIVRLQSLLESKTITPLEFETSRMKILRSAGIAPAHSGAETELARIKVLHTGGQLNDSDYESQRREILERF
jgi:hypothetical protein